MMKCKAVISFKKDDLKRIEKIIEDNERVEALKFLGELDKKITEFIEPK